MIHRSTLAARGRASDPVDESLQVLDLYRGLLKLEYSRHAHDDAPIHDAIADFGAGGSDWRGAAARTRVTFRAVENLRSWPLSYPSESDLRHLGPSHVQQINFGWFAVHYVASRRTPLLTTRKLVVDPSLLRIGASVRSCMSLTASSPPNPSATAGSMRPKLLTRVPNTTFHWLRCRTEGRAWCSANLVSASRPRCIISSNGGPQTVTPLSC